MEANNALDVGLFNCIPICNLNYEWSLPVFSYLLKGVYQLSIQKVFYCYQSSFIKIMNRYQ